MQLVIVNTKWEAAITPSIIILRGKVPTTRGQGILCTLSMRWLMTMNFGCAFFTGLVAFNNPLVMQFTLCGACLCDAWLFFTLLPHYITLKYSFRHEACVSSFCDGDYLHNSHSVTPGHFSPVHTLTHSYFSRHEADMNTACDGDSSTGIAQW